MKTSERISEQQFNTIISGLENDGKLMDRLYCVLQYYLGLRVGDVLSLTWSDVIQNGVIKEITTIKEQKTSKYRTIKLNKKVISELKRHYKGQTGYIINHNGSSFTVRAINYKIDNWRFDYLKNGIKNFSSHSFRKGFGYNVWLKMNKSAESLVLLMGIFNHTSMDVTKKYIGITSDEQLSVYDLL